MLIVIALLIATAANAEPLQPQPKIGAVCPTGWSAIPTSGYCVTPRPRN